MITDIQVRKLKKYLSQGKTLEVASARSGMDEKTGRKYRDSCKLPSDIKTERTRDWRTRDDPFDDVWPEALPFLENNEGLDAKTLFEHLQRVNPGSFNNGQLRAFQRRVKTGALQQARAVKFFFPTKTSTGKIDGLVTNTLPSQYIYCWYC